jgi:hypothetical protein
MKLQMKSQMKREALAKLNRQANEMPTAPYQNVPGKADFETVPTQQWLEVEDLIFGTAANALE